MTGGESQGRGDTKGRPLEESLNQGVTIEGQGAEIRRIRGKAVTAGENEDQDL